jgi:hypothetical protein
MANFADPRDMTKFNESHHEQEFRVFIVPSGIESILDQLRAKAGLRVIEETAPSSRPIEVDSPIRNRLL